MYSDSQAAIRFLLCNYTTPKKGKMERKEKGGTNLTTTNTTLVAAPPQSGRCFHSPTRITPGGLTKELAKTVLA